MKPHPPLSGGGARSSSQKIVTAKNKISLTALTFAVSSIFLATAANAANYYEWHASSPSIETSLTNPENNGYFHFSSDEDLTIIDSKGSGHWGGYGLIGPNQIFHVGAELGSSEQWNHSVNFSGQPDFLVRGTDTSVSTSATSASGDVSEQKGLAVIAVNGLGSKLTGNVWFDASGYVLVSAPTIELSGLIGTFAPTTAPNDAKTLTNPNVDKTLLVFQYQNPKNGMFDISTIAEDKRFTENGGIYIDTENSALTFNSAILKSHADIIVDLGNTNLTLTGSTQVRSGYDSNGTVIDGIQRVLFEQKEGGTGTVQMSGTSGIVTEKLDLAGGAKVVVNTDSTSYIGTIGKGTEGATLTLGGEGFSLGSASEGANGLIDVQGDHVFAGGDIYYEGTASTPDSTGLKASGTISMADGAKLGVLSLNNAILQGAGGINLAVDKLVMSNNAYMRGGDGSNTKGNINITADSIELTDAFIGRDGSGWMNVQGETLNTTITANTINLDSSFIIGEEKVTLNTTGTNSTLTIIGSAEDTEIGLRTNGGITVGSASNPFQSVRIEGQGVLRADGGRSDNDLEIYANNIYADGQANGSTGSMYWAKNAVAYLHTNSIHLHDDKSFIKGAKGVEISSLNEEVLNIAIRNGGNLGYDAGEWETLTDHGNISGQYVNISATKGVSITGGALIASGVNSDGNSITINGGDGDTRLRYLWTDASSVNAGKVGIYANAGHQINIFQSQIRDDITEETEDGTLTIAINGLTNESGRTGTNSDIYVQNSTISDDTIIIGSGYETIYSRSGHFDPDKSFLMNASEFTASGGRIGFEDKGAAGEITINTKKTTLSGTGILSTHENGVQINSSESLSLSGGAHIGFNDGNTDTGSLVSIKTPSLTLDNTSYITSEGAVSIGAFDSTGNVSIVMDGASTDTENPSWIKGQTVDISGNGVNIAGGQISSTGNTGDDINITSSGSVNFENTSIDAGDDGEVNIITGMGTEGAITGTNISGGSISFAGNDESDDWLDFGKIVIDQNSSITAGTTGGNGGKINIGTGVNVVVSNNASLTANQGTNDESTGIDVNGGKLTIEAGGVVTSGNDVDVTGGGSIDFTGTADPSTGVDPGKLIVGGNLNVGGQSQGGSGDDSQSGAIVVDEGAQGVIVVKNPDQDPAIGVTSGGTIGVGTGGSLLVTTDENQTPSADQEAGLIVGGGLDITVDGGTLEADKIYRDDSDTDKVTVTDNNSYVAVKDPFDESGENLSFEIDTGTGNGLTLEVGQLTKDELDKLNEKLEQLGTGATITTVVGPIEGLEGTLTLEKWDEEIGKGNVTANGGVDISEASGDDNRNKDEIGHGGGSFLVGSGEGPITITGPNHNPQESGNVTITGSQTQDGADDFMIVRPSDPDTENSIGIAMEDDTNLTLGNQSSWGGKLNGDIAVEGENSSANLDVIGGHWNIAGKVDLGSGDLVLDDRFEGDGSKDSVLNIGKDVTAGNLFMQGDHTELTTNGKLDLTGDATISGGTQNENSGAHISVGNGLEVDGKLSMTGNSHAAVTGSSTIGGGMIVEAGSSYETSANDDNEGDLTVTGGNAIFNGSVNVSGDFKNAESGNIPNQTVVTGTTQIGGDAKLDDLTVGSKDGNASSPNGSYTSLGDTIVGNNFTANHDSFTTIGGDFTVTNESSIKENASVSVAGNATFTGGLHIAENGTFENTSSDKETTVDGYLILDEGSSLQAGGNFILNEGTSIGAETGGDGTLFGTISAENIDMTQANAEITFSGESAGTNAHWIKANSTTGITYENGAHHVFTKDEDDPEGGIVTGTINIGTGGSLTMDPSKLGSSDQAYVHFNDSLKLDDTGSVVSKVIVGNYAGDTSQAGIYLGTDAVFDLSTSGFADGDKLVTVGGELGKIYLSDGSTVNIGDWTLGTDATLSVDFEIPDGLDVEDFLTSDNVLQSFWYNDNNNQLGMQLNSSEGVGTDDDFSGVVDAIISASSEDSRKQKLINEVFSKTSGFMSQTADGSWVVNKQGNQRIQDVLSLPIAAGAFNIAYDAMSEMNQTMANRMAEPITAHSVSVWADVIATYNSADELFGNSGYSADIYAAVMGADVGITEDWIAGVAFTIGQGDADGEGDTMGIQNDADFYGFSVYTAKNVGQLRFSGDMGYLKLKNDISTDVNYGGKGDTDVITVGARMDMTVHQGEQFDVTPHFGIRYANFNIDTINGTATNDINVVEVPLGVTVKGKTSMNGWKVAPMVDVSVVPQFGDKKAKIWNSGVAYEQDVLDSALVKTSVGVSAQKGNFTFGLNYRLGAGNDERQNHSFNANIRYQF